jgi:hypothetical protein
MASTYSTLKIELIATGEQSGTWGDTTNTNLGTAIEEAIVGSADVAFSSADVTLTLTNTNATQEARHLRLNLTGTSGGARNLILGSGCQIDKPYLINNGLADTVTVKNTTGTGIAVPAGKTMWVYNNGTNVVDAVTHLSSLTLGTALPITSGGTGSTSTTFVNLATNVTGTLPVANGGTGQTSYTDGQLLIGNTTGNTLAKATLTAGTGISVTNGAGSISIAALNNGTVTQVATGSGLTGGPITGSGTVSVATNGITDALFRQSSGLSVVGRSADSTGNVADVTAATDNQVLRRSGTSIGFGAVNLGSTDAVTGDLPFSNLAQGSALSVLGVTGNSTADNASIAAGSDHQVLRRSGTSVAFGAVALNQTNAITGTLPVGNGGTGGTSFTANNVLLGNGTSAFQVVSPGTTGNVLTSNGSTWTSAAPSGATLSGNNAFTGANTFFNGTGQTFGTATSSQDGIVITGRAGGSSSRRITLTPADLSGNRTITLPDPGSNETLGYVNTPINSQSAAYTLVLTDAGKTILHPDSDNNARTFTIPANGSVAYPVGTVVTFVNMKNTLTIAITTDTMYLAGPGTTGSRTLAEYGVATAVKLTSTTWLISGNGIS